MIRVNYIYDVEGWAIHNLGLTLKEGLAKFDIQLNLMPESESMASAANCDIIFLGTSRLNRQIVEDLRGPELITVVHDPVEISNFTGRFDWSKYPLRSSLMSRFDRVAVTTDEMYFQVSSRLKPKACYRLRTPVPTANPVVPLRNSGALRVGSSIRLNQKVRKQKRVQDSSFDRFRNRYLLSEGGEFSITQLRGVFGQANRKNPKYMAEIEEYFSRTEVSVEFMGVRERSERSREAYLQWLENLDIYVCTSTMEGGPIPLMEACQRGCAVLTTPVGQTADWVVHGKSGFILRDSGDFIKSILAYESDRELLYNHQLKSIEIASQITPNYESWAKFIVGK